MAMTTPLDASASHHPVVEHALASGPRTRSSGSPSAITRFAGSMRFVYIHIVVFAVVDDVREGNPWPS